MRNPGGKGFSRGLSAFPQKKAGSKGCRKTSAEARPLQGGTTAPESEGIALPAGPRASHKTGGGQEYSR